MSQTSKAINRALISFGSVVDLGGTVAPRACPFVRSRFEPEEPEITVQRTWGAVVDQFMLTQLVSREHVGIGRGSR